MSYETLSDTDRALVDRIIGLLNEMTQADREAVQLLVETRVPCNDALADHPTVQVHSERGRHTVGLLGILNGILGADDEGWGYVCAVFDDHMQLVNFKPTPPRKPQPKPGDPLVPDPE
jgi:hypothetical protein